MQGVYLHNSSTKVCLVFSGDLLFTCYGILHLHPDVWNPTSAVPKTSLLPHPSPTDPQSSWFRVINDEMTTDSEEMMDRVKNQISRTEAKHRRNYNRQQAD